MYFVGMARGTPQLRHFARSPTQAGTSIHQVPYREQNSLQSSCDCTRCDYNRNQFIHGSRCSGGPYKLLHLSPSSPLLPSRPIRPRLVVTNPNSTREFQTRVRARARVRKGRVRFTDRLERGWGTRWGIDRNGTRGCMYMTTKLSNTKVQMEKI